MSGLSGCQDTPEQKFTNTKTDSNIIGGETVDPESKFASRVIYLAIGVEKKTTPLGFTISQKGICTASALSQRVLLTAAHCVKNLTNEQVYAVMSNNPWNHPLDLEEWVTVEKIKIHHDYVGTDENMNHDLALLRLSRDIDIERISKLVDASQAKAGPLSLVSIGYGQTSTLKTPHTNNSQTQTTMLHSVLKTIEQYEPLSPLFSVEQDDMKGVCHGDSGGPGFLFDEAKKEFYVLGVTSFVSIFSNEQALRDPHNQFNVCIGRGNYTNALFYKDWIHTGLKELK